MLLHQVIASAMPQNSEIAPKGLGFLIAARGSQLSRLLQLRVPLHQLL